jgi:hypothetical protein
MNYNELQLFQLLRSLLEAMTPCWHLTLTPKIWFWLVLSNQDDRFWLSYDTQPYFRCECKGANMVSWHPTHASLTLFF